MTKAVNLVLILLVLGFLCVPSITSQTTEISYQGTLNVSGLPANSNYDFEFRLYDLPSGGTQVGSLISQNGIAVANGVFAVRLDFGQNFPGADRYLDIAVRQAGGGGFTLLNPRQKIGSTPYAIRSISAANATNAVMAGNALSLGGIVAAQYVLTADSRLTDARAPLGGSPSYVQNTNSQQASSNFNVSGTGTANIFNAATRYNFNGNHLISALGADNVFVGAGSGLLNTGNTNTFVGANAGFENKAGFNNSFFGSYAGQNNVTGANNSFFGVFSGSATTSGSDNSFFGHRSGLSNSAGAYNSFFGTFAGTFNTIGSDNSFFGNSTGYNSNGNRNSFFGSQAGYQNSAGSDNSFLGSFAGRANTTGSNNAFVGSSAGSLNATGLNNSFFGSNSGSSNTASGNSFFGMDSGYFNNSGANNSFFGRAAGRGNTTGELNVFIGLNAGTNNTLGNSNTIIGSEANLLGSNLSYATAIGAEAVVSTNNTVVLGRPVDAVRIPGNLNVMGTFTAVNFSLSASNITGVLGTGNGGTGLALAGTSGNFLRSDGTNWQSQPFLVADIPSGSVSYIHNNTVQQGTSNFNISGNGTVGGTFSGNAINSLTQYNVSGSRVLSNSGIGNLFAGVGAGIGNTTGASNSFFGNSAGSMNSSAGGNSFFGASAGVNATTGPNNTFVGLSSGQTSTTGANNAYFGANSGQANTIGSNNTLVGSNSNVGANNLTYATAIGSDAVVSTNNSVVLGRTVDTVRVPGNLNVQGTLTATTFSIPATSITGVIATLNGGTGLGTSGSSGNYLRSNGSAWTSSAIASGDLPAGNANYIQNGAGLQATSNFNISGTGTVGGLFSANAVNSTTQYNIGGTRVFTANGINNIFIGAGTATSGDNNSFIGANTALSNTTGTSNTIIGSGGNVGAGNLIFATALGSGAIVNDNNSVVLGRVADTVRVPGNLIVTGTFTAASFTLPAANITGVLASANGGTGVSASGLAGNVLRSNGTTWASSTLIASDIPNLGASYIQNGIGLQAASNFNISGNGTIGGNLVVAGSISGGFSVPATNITGVLARANGGTGLSASGASGNFLKSDGTNWFSSALSASDIPTGSTNYIQNGATTQTSSNFNISGAGTVGGLFSANTVNSATQYNIGGNRVFTTTGTNNVFVGAGTATNGSSNTFVGDGTGTTNTTGNSNTLVGANANVGAASLTFATAVGSGAVVGNNDSVVLGRNMDTVRVPGNLTVTGTFTAATFTLPAANITGTLASANGGTGLSSSGIAGNVLRSNGTTWASSALTSSDIPNLGASYVQNGIGLQTGSFNISGAGTIGGNLVVGGTISGAFNVPAANITGVLSRVNGGTGLSASGSSGNFLKSDGTNWFSSALLGSDIPSGSANYIHNNTTLQTLSNFNISGSGTLGGNLVVGGSITGAFSVPATNITGTLALANGGTGLSASGITGNVLRSNGTTWASSALIASDLPNLGASYIQNGIGLQTGNFNISGAGTIGGNLVVGGTISGAFSVPAANITGVLARANGGTGLGLSGANGNFLRSDGTNWASSGLTALDIPTGSTNYIQNGLGLQSASNFNISGAGTVGTNLNVGGNLTVTGAINGTFTVGAANITGVVAGANGGTGVSSSGTTGNVLRSNGSIWASSPLQAADIPSLGGTYIQNGTLQQASSNFNVSGNGTVGGTVSAGIVNATTQYNIGGTRVFATTGTSNIFAGAGTGTTGSSNSFFGDDAGNTISSGSSNTIIGANADVATGTLTNSTAIGANASVSQSNSLILGAINGTNGGSDTSVGIGTTAPKAKLDVTGGAILVGSPGQGIILKSPNGATCKLMTIDDAGAMVLATVTCP